MFLHIFVVVYSFESCSRKASGNAPAVLSFDGVQRELHQSRGHGPLRCKTCIQVMSCFILQTSKHTNTQITRCSIVKPAELVILYYEQHEKQTSMRLGVSESH